MLNLKKQSGLPITFDGKTIQLGKEVTSEPMHARTLEDACPFLMDKNLKPSKKNLYLMYRDVHATQDEALFRKNRLRYDITVILPGTIGGKKGEFIRTIGHTHPAPEIYEVLDGEAMFVLQQFGEKASNTFYITATKGEKVLIPSGYGHITVNTGKEPLILADLFADYIKSDYSAFKKKCGAAYWVLPPEWKMQGITLAENRAYKGTREVSLGAPANLSAIGLPKKIPIYALFTEDPKQFSFLTDPKKETQVAKKNPLFIINWQGSLA